jgi:serine/threonine-protein kinase
MTAITQIANFKITNHLGKGGMGDVYCAVQEPLGRKVALKILMTSHGDKKARQRFEIEAKAISRLEHNNIVSLYDYGIENNLSYFSMQYVEGFALSDIIPHTGLPIANVIDYSKQICRGLLYAHKKGIIHRDIKPQNILIDHNDLCSISDFGIAKLFREQKVTSSGMAVGTPEYMSPEQASGKELDLRTDIYSLGILMYEMLTGDVPFTGEKALSIAYSHVHTQPKPPSAHRRDIPKRLELIVIKALKKNPTERYCSIAEVLDDLDTVSAHEKERLYAQQEKEKAENRRITDRRLGDRRGTGKTTAQTVIDPFCFTFFSRRFWYYTLRQQWLALILIILLLYIEFFR